MNRYVFLPELFLFPENFFFLLFQLLAHEIGHNIGMKHDFDPSHKGKGCVKNDHVMSYGNSKKKWSECSKKDFEAHYLMTKNNWCMKGLLIFALYICRKLERLFKKRITILKKLSIVIS